MGKPLRVIRYPTLPLSHSIAGRILLVFGMMAFLSFVVALSGIYYTSQSSTKLVALLEQDERFATLVSTMEVAAEQQNSSVRAFLLSSENRSEERSLKEIDVATASYEAAARQLSRLATDIGLPPEKYALVREFHNDYAERVDSVRVLKLSDFPRAPIFLWESDGPRNGPALKVQLTGALNDLLLNYRQGGPRRIDEARNQGLVVTAIALLLVTVAGLLAVLVTLLITRKITRPLRKLAGVARAIRQGDLNVHVPVIAGEDEVANLAGAMASMAENLRISRHELENSLENSRRRNRELSALNRVAATIGSTLDLDVVLHDALHELMTVYEMEYGSMFLMESDGQHLRLTAHYNQIEDYMRLYKRIEVGSFPSGLVASQGEVLVLENPLDDPRQAQPILKLDTHKKFYLGVPFKSKGNVVGVAALTSRTIQTFEERDLELLRAVGNQIGVAIDNARLYQQAQQVAVLEERNRLARDLHDSVTQTLFSITLTSESLKTFLVRKPEKVEAQVDRLQNLARGALAEMRSLIFQLRPVALQEQGLVAALEKHIAVLRTKEAFQIELVVEGERRLSDEHEQALYRIAQEAFNNISKHSAATHVWVKLVIDDDGATLTIRDDGEGFDAARVLATNDRGSLGLTSMRERSDLAGGTFEIESSPGNGTSICVCLPLDYAPRPVGMGINT